MTVGSALLTVERQAGGVVLATLNRSEARNALSARLRADIVRCFEELARADETHAVILTGAGDMFSAGFDLKELAAGNAAEIFAAARQYHRTVYDFPKPLIAAVNGPALAGGMDLAAMCDLRVAADTAVFGQPQVKMGIPAAYDLIRTVMAEPVARELCLTGARIDAAAAVAAGFVSKAAPLAELPAVAFDLAQAAAQAAAAGSGSMKPRFVAAQPKLFGG